MLPPVARTRSDVSTGASPISEREAAAVIEAAARFGNDERGATAIEYGLISGLVFLAIVLGIQSYADSMNGVYSAIETAITKAK
jgi:pilus assembly protein Flp/PilA